MSSDQSLIQWIGYVHTKDYYKNNTFSMKKILCTTRLCKLLPYNTLLYQIVHSSVNQSHFLFFLREWLWGWQYDFQASRFKLCFFSFMRWTLLNSSLPWRPYFTFRLYQHFRLSEYRLIIEQLIYYVLSTVHTFTKAYISTKTPRLLVLYARGFQRLDQPLLYSPLA